MGRRLHQHHRRDSLCCSEIRSGMAVRCHRHSGLGGAKRMTLLGLACLGRVCFGYSHKCTRWGSYRHFSMKASQRDLRFLVSSSEHLVLLRSHLQILRQCKYHQQSGSQITMLLHYTWYRRQKLHTHRKDGPLHVRLRLGRMPWGKQAYYWLQSNLLDH